MIWCKIINLDRLSQENHDENKKIFEEKKKIKTKIKLSHFYYHLKYSLNCYLFYI